MSFSESEKIVDNPDHPLRAKALEVRREAVAPITAALNELTGSSASSPQWNTPLWVENLLSPSIVEMPSDGVPASAEMPAHEGSPAEVGGRAIGFGAVEPLDMDLAVVDFDDVEPPGASLAEIAEASQVKAQEIWVRQVEILSQLLAQARADAESSKQALAIAERSKTAGWVAAWAAIAAVVIGVAGIGITVLLG